MDRNRILLSNIQIDRPYMNCWHCGTELIWGGDHDLEKDDNETYDMVTNLTCPNCQAYVEVYMPRIIENNEHYN